MNRRATGLRRATAAHRQLIPVYSASALPTMGAVSGVAQQRIARIIDQGRLPACVGCAMCAGAEAIIGIPPNLSWVRIWTDARRRDGELHDPDSGTWFTSAIESVTNRGLDPEEPEEWKHAEEMTEPDDLDSEMAAYDRRQVGTERWRAPSGDLEAVEDALTRGLIVAIGAGVKDPYFDFFATRHDQDAPDVILTSDALGGFSNGHEQRIVALETVNGARRWVIQNSWGHSGGCHLPDGTFAPGCAKVDDSVIRLAWDVDCIRVVWIEPTSYRDVAGSDSGRASRSGAWDQSSLRSSVYSPTSRRSWGYGMPAVRPPQKDARIELDLDDLERTNGRDTTHRRS